MGIRMTETGATSRWRSLTFTYDERGDRAIHAQMCLGKHIPQRNLYGYVA